MLQVDTPHDVVVGTGEGHSEREFLVLASGRAGFDWEPHMKLDPRCLCPADLPLGLNDASTTRENRLKPTVTFPQVVARMVDADLVMAARNKRS